MVMGFCQMKSQHMGLASGSGKSTLLPNSSYQPNGDLNPVDTCTGAVSYSRSPSICKSLRTSTQEQAPAKRNQEWSSTITQYCYYTLSVKSMVCSLQPQWYPKCQAVLDKSSRKEVH